MSFLALHDVGFQYPGSRPVLQGVSLAIAAGEVHCFVGRSGCGKTTLLKLAAGLLAPTRGRIVLRGGASPDPQQAGFVFQAPTLLDWLRVTENVLLPVSLQRRPTPADREGAEGLLDRLGLTGLGGRYPRQLSGGQQSRVALARALLRAPPLLLLDEPFAAVDALTREELQRDLLRLVQVQGTTVLFVTHDVGEAVFLGDRASVLAHGKLVGTTELPAPAERDTPAFGAACAALRATLAAFHAAPEEATA